MDILLIDDSPTHQFQLARNIEAAGHSIEMVFSGEAALQFLEKSSVDLILCDIEMPGLSGYETVTIIRELLADSWIPIIFMTSRDNTIDVVKGFRVGADDYLVKPINPEVLLAKLKVMERYIAMQEVVFAHGNLSIVTPHYDEFSRVYTPQYFFERALQQWAIMARQRLPVSVLIVDIDDYSLYRDYYGESLANECLVKISNKLNESIFRPADFVGRFQKEGFILMLPDTGRSGASLVAERIRCGIENLTIENKASRGSSAVTVSVGGGTCYQARRQPLHRCIELACDSLIKVRQIATNSVYVDSLPRIETDNVSISSEIKMSHRASRKHTH
ncbi:response regulator [Aliikangiella marina]|uniref:Response regulator n=1 Tax=Aliikangiella marina TaxID=1712262 RepID=A0A545TCP9_9GAMM|nr:response regulator [Aliikangiella marina]TQV74956.1 response regulator [Aliikangiella marina]